MGATWVILNFLVTTLKKEKEMMKLIPKLITFYLVQYIQNIIISNVISKNINGICYTFCIMPLEIKVCFTHIAHFIQRRLLMLSSHIQCFMYWTVRFKSLN